MRWYTSSGPSDHLPLKGKATTPPALRATSPDKGRLAGETDKGRQREDYPSVSLRSTAPLTRGAYKEELYGTYNIQ